MPENNINKTDFERSEPLKRKITIADLYPDLSSEEQAEAEYNLKRYVRLIWRIFERVNRENPALLTKELEKARLKEQQSPDKSDCK